MSSLRIGFVGDPHVGRAESWVDQPTALRMHRQLLEQQLDYCRRARCDCVVILGDLFDDPHPNQDELVMVLKVLVSERDRPILTIAGNHDVHDANENSLKLLSELPGAGALRNVSFRVKPGVIRWEGFRVLALPWGHRPPDVEYDLMAFHDTAAGSRSDNGRVNERGMEDFRSTSIGGHIHTPQNSGLWHYAGTAAQMSFGEEPDKRFHWVTLRTGREPEVRSVPIRDRIWTLRKVRYDPDDPPSCDEPRTFYSLDLSGGNPGPRWMVDHPRVVKHHGGSQKKLQEAAERVVTLLDGGSARGEDDRDLLRRWLRMNTGLDKLSTSMALRIHDKLEEGRE